MISLDFKIESLFGKVKDRAKEAGFKNIGHAAARIRKDAIDSILRDSEASEPGTPPHTRRGQLRQAIVYAADRESETAVVGPRESIVGQSGAAHEFGEEFHGDKFPERPFMGPALSKNKDRFATDWQGSIGE